jgi:hypothetical protein
MALKKFSDLAEEDPQMACEALYAGFGWLMALANEPTVAFDLEKYSGDYPAIDRLSEALRTLAVELRTRGKELQDRHQVVLPVLE